MTTSALALSNLRELAQAALAEASVDDNSFEAIKAKLALQAACSPDAILALLDQLDAAQEALRLAFVFDHFLQHEFITFWDEAGRWSVIKDYGAWEDASEAFHEAMTATRARQEEP